MSDTPSHPAPPRPTAPHADGAPDGPPKITAREVASATAVGAATRLGMAKRKANAAEGSAVGSAPRGAKRTDRSQLITGLVVVGVMVGTLALMIVLNK